MKTKFLDTAKFKKATKERGISDYSKKLLKCHGIVGGCGTHKGCTLHPENTNN